jgi:putative FmdB family regulatory protein
MPSYPYRCSDPSCDHHFEVVKCIADIDLHEKCELCQSPATRYIGRTHFYGASDWDKAHYNIGLGCECSSHKHARQIAKSRGLEEAGDYKPDKMISDADSSRQRRIDERWARA